MHPLKKYRIRHGLNQRELAARLEITPGYLSHIELGRRAILPKEARRYEITLGYEVSKEELVFFELTENIKGVVTK